MSVNIQNTPQHYLYVDDLRIYSYFKSEDLSISIKNVSKCLRNVSSLAEANSLFINPRKSQTIILGSPYNIHKINQNPIPQTFLGTDAIHYSNTGTNLGLIFYQTLSWRAHINHIRRNFFFA